MEKLWAVMILKVNGLDNTVSRVVEDHQEDLLRLWNHHKHGEALHATWKDSKVLSELEKLLSQLDQSTSIDLKRKRDRDDQDNTPDTYGDELGAAVQLEPEYRVSDLLQPEHTTPNNTSLTQFPSANVRRQLPDMAPGLIDHYFIYTHCWFPILSKPYTLKTFYECRRQNTSPLPDTSALACLWALCAYSRQQALHSQLPLSDRESISSQVENWRTIARELIPRDGEGSHPGHVQALLLLVLLDFGLGRWSSAWVMVGQAVRMLLDRVSSLQDPPKEWLATLQGSFILDTMVAHRLGRPPHLQSQHIRYTKLLDQDSHEEWEPWNAPSRAGPEFAEPAFTVSCFNRATELCSILNAKSTSHPSQESSYELGLQVQRVAESMSFPVVVLERRPPHQMLLQLHYFATLVNVSQLNGEGQLAACWKFVEVLELCNDLWSQADTAAIPSLAVLLCHDVESTLSALVDVPGTLPANILRQRLRQAKSKMSGVWPSLKGDANMDTPEQQSTTWDTGRLRSSTAGTSFPLLDTATGTTPSLLSTQSSYWPIRRDTIATQARATGPGNEMAIPSIGHEPKVANLIQAFDRQPPLANQSLDYGTMSIDIPDPQERLNTFVRLGSKEQSIGGATSSPSFNGDEIDALFHEMAELDTTQWSLNRSQGLRDFGFQDDSTFEAFCNDPDRLMLSDNYMGPAFSNNVTHVGNQGAYSSSLQPQGGGSGIKQGPATFDIFDSAWQG